MRIAIREAVDYLDFLRCATVHIFHNVAQHLTKRRIHRLGKAAYLGETVGYELETLHVFVHFRYEIVVRVSLAENFSPCHQRTDRRAELMCRLLRQSHPYLVLLRFLGCEQGENGNNDEYHHYAQLNIGIVSQSLDHQRLIEADVNKLPILVVFIEINADDVARSLHITGEMRSHLQTVRQVAAVESDVSVGLHRAFFVHHDDRDVIVFIDNLEHEVEVGVLVSSVERAHGFCPDLHSVFFLNGKVAHKEM